MTESTPAPTRAAAFSGGIVLGLKTDRGEGDQQRERGRGEQHHLDPPAQGQLAPIEQQGREAADDEEQDEEDDQPCRVPSMIDWRWRLIPDDTKKTGMKKP